MAQTLNALKMTALLFAKVLFFVVDPFYKSGLKTLPILVIPIYTTFPFVD